MSYSYTFGGNVKPLLNLTLCGVPEPNVTWSFGIEGGFATGKLVQRTNTRDMWSGAGFECYWVQQYKSKIANVCGQM